MREGQTVLLVGGTGRTGRRVLEQLLNRGVDVRAIVRSAGRLPAGVAANPRLTVVETDLLALGDGELRGHVRGCDAVISCLGHVLSLEGTFGPPRDLVTLATQRLCRAIEAVQPARPIRFILMSSVSVNRPRRLDARRGTFERAFVAAIRGLLPPARDNQRAADFLCRDIGTDHPSVQWAVVRPDTLVDGDVSEYAWHEGLVSSFFRPGRSNMANVAHAMCALATDGRVWERWKGRWPVVVNAGATAR
jgi:nucleoside-diphosphate-sugar epimerase